MALNIDHFRCTRLVSLENLLNEINWESLEERQYIEFHRIILLFTRAISDHMCRLMMANFMLGQVL
jgi:hypothetical protein